MLSRANDLKTPEARRQLIRKNDAEKESWFAKFKKEVTATRSIAEPALSAYRRPGVGSG